MRLSPPGSISDPLQVKARFLKQLVGQSRSGDASQLSTVSASCVKFAEEAAASGAIDEASDVLDAAKKSLPKSIMQAQTAQRAAKAALARARTPADKAEREKKAAEAQAELDAIKSAQSALAECAKGLQQARHEHEAIQAAQERLKTDPDDPDACLAVGRWYCFQQGDWDEGLKLLAKGSDAALKSLAAEELASKPSKAEDKVARGDAWWDLAEKADGQGQGRHAAACRSLVSGGDAGPAAGPGEIEGGKTSCPSDRGAAAGGRAARSARIRPPLAVAPFNEKTAKQHQTRWAKYLRVPVVQTNSIGMKLVLIPPGEFQMGSPKELIEEELRLHGDDDWYRDHLPGEGPQHRVRITKPVLAGRDGRDAGGVPARDGQQSEQVPRGPEKARGASVVGRRGGILPEAVGVACGKGGQATVRVADGGPVGVCLPCGNDDPLVFGRRRGGIG